MKLEMIIWWPSCELWSFFTILPKSLPGHALFCPILPKGLICYFLLFCSLVFSDTAYNDGWEWYKWLVLRNSPTKIFLPKNYPKMIFLRFFYTFNFGTDYQYHYSLHLLSVYYIYYHTIAISQLQLSLESHNVRPSVRVGFTLSSVRITFLLHILLFGMVLSVFEKKKSAPPPSPLEWPILRA